jgi:LysM repeat protein
MTRSPMRGRSRVTQFLAGLVSAVVLIALVAGIPIVLLRLGTGLMPHHVPSWAEIRDGLLHKDVSGSLFIQALLVIGWAAWGSFALSVLVELVARFRGRSTVRLPGMRAQQRWAAALIAAITLMFVSPALANAASLVKRPVAAVAAAVPAASNQSAPHQSGSNQSGSNRPTSNRSAANVVTSTITRNDTGSNAAGGNAGSRSGTANADSTNRPADASRTLTYHVQRGDYLGAIAERFGGTFDQYHALATANHITDPSHIEAGWTIRLPANAVDLGPRLHAGGKVTGTGRATVPPTTTPPVGSQTPAPHASGHAPTPATHSPTNPAPTTATRTPAPQGTEPRTTTRAGAHASPAPVPSRTAAAVAASGDHGDSSHAGTIAVEMLEASGTLAGVIMLAMLAVSRREQLQRRTVRQPPQTGVAGGSMPRLMAPTQQRDMIRIDSSLRSLAAMVDGWPIERIPQIAGVWMDQGSVTLMLADDCGAAPEPFVDDPNGWMLRPDGMLTPHTDQLAPLPTLVTVGGRTGQHLLLDIEYLRFLGIGGDRTEAMNLLRFVAAELTHNVWSDDVRVVMAGFGDEATGLAAIDPDRVRIQPSVAEAVVRFRRRVARAVANWDAPPGPPEILLIAHPMPEDADELVALERDLMRAPGVGMAVVIGGTPDGFEASRYQVQVGTDGLLRVGFLGDAVMPAASLPDVLVPEVASLIQGSRNGGDPSPLDLARAASQVLLRLARSQDQTAAPGDRASVLRRTATLAGQHRRPPGQKPEPREALVDLMKPRHVRSA